MRKTKTIYRKEFKAQVITMTKEQKEKFHEIQTRLVAEVNETEFKTKSGYKSAMKKAYDRTIQEYIDTL